MQTGLIHGTGMAFLGGSMKVVAPVLEGDTIRVEVEVTRQARDEEDATAGSSPTSIAS